MNINTDEAIKSLEAGLVIGVPTDTVYGLSSLKQFGSKIYEVKNRDKAKKLVTMLSDVNQIDVTNQILLQKMEEVWPGPVTLIFDYQGEMTSFRIPDEPNLLALLEKLGKPIYTTSANISGKDPCLTRDEFNSEFPNIGLLNEEYDSQKSTVPSEIYVFKNDKFERIR